MSYRVHLEKLVVGATGSCVVEREMELPFAPYPGLEIVLGEEDQGETIAEVVWVARANRFVVVVQPWKDADFDFRLQLATLIRQGWSLVDGYSRARRTE